MAIKRKGQQFAQVGTLDPNKPTQMPLFMTGTEWEGAITHSTDGPMDRIWPQKQEQADNPGAHHGSGLTQSMVDKGYQHDPQSPPTIVLEASPSGREHRKVQSEGHHRIAAAASAERRTGVPQYIPTTVVDNTRR